MVCVNNMKMIILSFVIGTSILVSIPTLTYNGLALRRNPGAIYKVAYEYMPVVIPLIFGLANVLIYSMVHRFKIKKWQNQLLLTMVVGALTGLTFSLIGRFGFKLPEKLYNMAENKHYLVHPIAMILYSLIFSMILFPLNSYLLFD